MSSVKIKSSLTNKSKNLIKSINSFKKNQKKIEMIIEIIYQKIINGGKILLCGNGGSAADAQHLAAEFLVRLRPNINRPPIPAISLALDSSTLTACGNDYSFSDIFARNLEALGSSKDVLIAISTSGNSKNIIKTLKKARKKNIFSISFLGSKGGIAKKFSDISLIVNSNVTATIQESHIFLGHLIFEEVENQIIKYIKKNN